MVPGDGFRTIRVYCVLMCAYVCVCVVDVVVGVVVGWCVVGRFGLAVYVVAEQ